MFSPADLGVVAAAATAATSFHPNGLTTNSTGGNSNSNGSSVMNEDINGSSAYNNSGFCNRQSVFASSEMKNSLHSPRQAPYLGVTGKFYC